MLVLLVAIWCSSGSSVAAGRKCAISFMKILLLGKDGQLGGELTHRLADMGELVAWGRAACDLSDVDALGAKVLACKPDLIVNAAAYTAVDKAESEPALAHAINAAAPAVLADVARKISAGLIHYSTDYVFDGSGTKPWAEDALTAPLNCYGVSKLAGEQSIVASGCQYLIFRTSWVYAKEGGNFAKTMLRLALERDTLSVIDDQIGTPTDAAWLADITATIANQWGGDSGGIYHATAAGEVSWHGYASYLIAKARELGFPIKVRQGAIGSVPSSAFPTPAKRPHNSRLDCSKLSRCFGISPPPWQKGIDQLLQHLKP